ncbi:anthranilate synthase component I [Pseudokineococcus sp. 1T1Z-3]|uniref:anthranilate synthase component I n=1 Tax=Pseudokineococcus sp. 1T1Z-3 TaxID=3132745 RepID=UPI0030AAC733
MTAGPDGRLGRTWPSLDVFRELARDRRVIPVVRRVLADGETPVGLYRKLSGDAPGSFLLESAEGGRWSRWSIVGARSSAMLLGEDGQSRWVGSPPTFVPADGEPTEVLAEVMAALSTPRLPGLPPLTGGMVGVLGYDVVRAWERLPARPADEHPDEIGAPAVMMALAADVAVLDHSDGTLLLVANAVNSDGTDERVDEAWEDACARLDRMVAQLAAPAPSTVAVHDGGPEQVPAARERTRREDYLDAVRRGQEAIVDGEVFQVVLSQRFEMDCPADALDVYRCLRASNPSPYMYLFRGQRPDGSAVDVVGSSPEALVKVEAGRVLAHPIAGTRPRGAKPEDDVRLAEELLEDVKERSEHLMLVDLARNDLAHVCDPGSVDVVEFMAVERYSHVMHLVSTVVGDARAGTSALAVLRSAFPAGTLSGAPKPRAMELIDVLEPVRRGVYGGVVGYLDFAGDLDMAIAIRTAVLTRGVAHVQAGAGVVADSVPEAEDAECRAKAAAVLRAVAAAVTLRPPEVGPPEVGPEGSPRGVAAAAAPAAADGRWAR